MVIQKKFAVFNLINAYSLCKETMHKNPPKKCILIMQKYKKFNPMDNQNLRIWPKASKLVRRVNNREPKRVREKLSLFVSKEIRRRLVRRTILYPANCVRPNKINVRDR